MKITRVGVDLAKNVFQVHGGDRAGCCVWKRQLKRSNWLQVLTETLEPGCEIGMEACGGSHHWARELRSRGFVVKLVSPQFVKPFVKSQKNDANDAEAVCEAISRPSTRYVPIKTAEQQDLQAMHRIRDTLMRHRKAKANQIRGLVAEYGIVAPKTIVPLRRAIPDWLEDAENGLSDNFRALLFGLWQDFQQLEQRVQDVDRQISAVSNANPDAKRLKQLRGVGPLVSTALVAQFGDGRQFTRGRQASASIGVTPRHAGTGGKNLIYGITKRGDPYLRSILIHGARAVVSQAKRRDDALSRWVTDLADRTHTNVAAVALANKTARMAWAMLRYGTDYDPELARASNTRKRIELTKNGDPPRRLPSELTMKKRSARRQSNPRMAKCITARTSDWELARAYPSRPGVNARQLKRPDIRAQSSYSSPNASLSTRRSPYTVGRYAGVKSINRESQDLALNCSE